MDSKRFHEAFERLQALDEIYLYKVRPRAGAMRRPDIEHVAEHQKSLAEYTIGLKEILHELFEAIATPTQKE
jgi:hypothetical protein